jgi:rhodanese-related sulfurtransferase
MATEFPYRKDYPEVPTIATEELNTKQDSAEVVIVDVRSKIEYDVIHPVGAVHIPVSHMSFVKEVGELLEQNPGQAVAFYCNGITCLKSYEAAKRAKAAGYKNCFAYDAGIPEWANLFPGKTLLLGKILVDPENQLIPKAEFKKRCLSFDDFKSKANDPQTIVIDVRDHIQSSGKLPELKGVLIMPLDKFISNFVEKKLNQDKTLLIFDQVGKQVRWLSYYLHEHGYGNYFYLHGGATEVLQDQTYK